MQKVKLIQLLIIILAALQPLIFISAEGYRVSLSTYWMTSFQPMFIITNAAISYHFFHIKGWKLSALLLLFLTAFSVEKYFIVHNILAIFFFLSCYISLLTCKRLKSYHFLYLISILFLTHSILLAEISAITILCIYHGHLMLLSHTLSNRSEQSR